MMSSGRQLDDFQVTNEQVSRSLVTREGGPFEVKN